MRVLWLLALSWGGVLYAQFPSYPGQDPWENRPNDPEYSNQWQLFSHIPKDHRNPKITEFDAKHGSGMSVDKAWQLHTGNSTTLISVLDSGVIWETKDIRNRIYINPGELPVPEGFNHHDANGDGRINIQDYAYDSRVTDHNKNEMLDTEDLILTFSDGVDSDGNGFVDDISGWDFVENDNNPGDRIAYGHGTFEATKIASEANNGIGSAGVCPDCTIMFMRVGDTFIVDTNSFAAGVLYSVDQGASIVSNALGGLSNNNYAKHAVEYAYGKGVLVIGTAADESSYHHNQPSMLDPMIYPNAVRYDNYLARDATTFVNFNNCSNYGPRVDVAVSGTACSSEATANLAGIAGLTYSFSRILNKPLTSGELISLIKTSVDDINFGSNQSDPSRYSTYEGWDSMTGYGRVNAWKMMSRIKEQNIPPSARIISPGWFKVFRTSQTPKIDVEVSIPVPRSGVFDVELSVAQGVETGITKFQSVKELLNQHRPISGIFASIDSSIINELPINTAENTRYRNALTLLLKVSDGNGNFATERRTVFLFEDPWLHKGFPIKLSGSGEPNGMFLDLDQDGRDEFIGADGSGEIFAIGIEGMMPGFPVHSPSSKYDIRQRGVRAAIVGAVSAGDLDQDGRYELVAATTEGHVLAFDASGQSLDGFPKSLDPQDIEQANPNQRLLPGILAAPTLFDIDDKPGREIIVVTLDGYVHAFDYAGKYVSGFPYKIERGGIRAKIVSSPTIADIDNDGTTELIFGTNHLGKYAGTVFALEIVKDGVRVKEGFPVNVPAIRDQVIPTIGAGVPASLALVDIDKDGIKEILAHSVMGKLYALDHRGDIKVIYSAKVSESHATNDTYMLTGFGHPSVGRFKIGGDLQPVAVGIGKKILTNLILGGVRYPYNHMLSVWDPVTGKMVPGFPRPTDDIMIFTQASTVDLNGDEIDEILYGSGGYYVHALTADGGEARGFPHFTGGWVLGAVNVGDFDGNGKFDVGATTREGYLYIWKTDFERDRAKKPTWPTFQGNVYRTGDID